MLSVKPFIDDTAEAAAAPQVKPVADDVSTLSTRLFVPRGNFIKVDPAPTNISPKLYVVYPVPPYGAEIIPF